MALIIRGAHGRFQKVTPLTMRTEVESTRLTREARDAAERERYARRRDREAARRNGAAFTTSTHS